MYVTDNRQDPRFGHPVPCPAGCDSDIARARLERLSGLRGDQLHYDFDLPWHPEQRIAVDILRSMLLERRGFVLISGPYGTGKTHMLAATVNHARRLGVPSVYVNAEELLDHLRRTYAPDTEISFDALWHRVSGAVVLCIDELGRENPTPWARSKLFELLDDRYECATVGSMRERVLTVIATNIAIAQLDGYLRSRVLDVRHDCVAAIELWNTPDMRQRS